MGNGTLTFPCGDYGTLTVSELTNPNDPYTCGGLEALVRPKKFKSGGSSLKFGSHSIVAYLFLFLFATLVTAEVESADFTEVVAPQLDGKSFDQIADEVILLDDGIVARDYVYDSHQAETGVEYKQAKRVQDSA